MLTPTPIIKFRKLLKLNFKRVFVLAVVAQVVILSACYVAIENYSERYIFNTLRSVPHNDVGLVLGTSKYLVKGGLNPYFTNRITAAANLFKIGKIRYILVSGDNGSRYYNEPLQMQQALIAQGVPTEAIVLDYAGFRTLDSVVRCKKVFGQQRVTIISQEFHNERAVYLGREAGLKAIAFNANDISTQKGLKVQLREVLARVKAVLDVYMETSPRFLGNPITIG
jgi:SanA protein